MGQHRVGESQDHDQGGAHKSFKFGKYAGLYLGAFNYRFNHRFDLAQLVTDVIVDVVRFGARPERVIRRCAEVHA